MEAVKTKTLPEALELVAVKKGSLLNEPKISTDDKMQDLILPIFSKRMGKWGKDLGQMINTVV